MQTAPNPVSRRQKANAIRALAMDAVQLANSGHPGAPMGMADFAEVLWADHLKHNPRNPNWCDRDRFVLSNGHASMLLYALLHLSGYALSVADLKSFRQLQSKTPGHPEYGDTPGVETTTGPLGQGLANAVGMAIAEKTLAARFNQPNFTIVDHFTYVCVGDGCLMEGVSHEACSLAGVLQLGKLIAIYDANGISIDGQVQHWFGDDTAKRFDAYGWHVIDDVDGHDARAVDGAIQSAKNETTRPSLIVCKTIIGFGSPNKAGSETSHGAPLGADEVGRAREELNWPHPPFVIPDELYAAWNATEAGDNAERQWTAQFNAYEKQHPQLAREFKRRMAGELPPDWESESRKAIMEIDAAGETIASRKASQNALEKFGQLLPELIGGSADLTESNLTLWSQSQSIAECAGGNYIYFGVREFAMCAIINGIALHRGFKPYGATFLVFSDYARNALRLAALMKIPALFIFTHDSIGLGEDGPTHQPVEHLASLRLIPNLQVWRPCDAVETAVAWRLAMQSRNAPFALALSRQSLPHQIRDATQLNAIANGGYLLKSCAGEPEIILIATGSETALATAAADKLKHKKIRVVSMPCRERFELQSRAYRESVLPPSCTARIVIEAGASTGWEKYAGANGVIIGLDAFGVSAPGDAAFKHFNFTVEHVIERVESLV